MYQAGGGQLFIVPCVRFYIAWRGRLSTVPFRSVLYSRGWGTALYRPLCIWFYIAGGGDGSLRSPVFVGRSVICIYRVLLLLLLLFCSVCCYTAVVAAAAAVLLFPAAVRHRVPDGRICCWFIESDPSASFLFSFKRDLFLMVVRLGSTWCRIYGLDLPTSSVITGMRGAKAGVSSPWRSPYCILHKNVTTSAVSSTD